MNQRSKVPTVAARIAGGTAIACAGFGLLFNAVYLGFSFGAEFAEHVEQEGLRFFYAAFYSMSIFCVLCYLALIYCGVQLVRGRFAVAVFFTIICVLEVVYSFAVPALAMRSEAAGSSIAAASGVSSGGLMAQFILLLPLWGPAAAMWARKATLHGAT